MECFPEDIFLKKRKKLVNEVKSVLRTSGASKVKMHGLDGACGGGLPPADHHVDHTTSTLGRLERHSLRHVRYIHIINFNQLVVHPEQNGVCQYGENINV